MNERQILIIGYGNTLRGDDGVGVKVAERIASKHWPNTRSIAIHQLTPELASDIADSELVIFVDAIVGNSPYIQIQTLESHLEWPNLGHLESPQLLLALARSIYQKSPSAWGIFIPAINCEFGEELSPITQNGLEKAIEAIETIIRSD